MALANVPDAAVAETDGLPLYCKITLLIASLLIKVPELILNALSPKLKTVPLVVV